MDARLDALQQRTRPPLLPSPAAARARCTHRSFGADHNERLEFLGDAVLSLAISSLLFERFGGSDEGDLTRVRAHLVREDSLHRVALSARPARGAAARRGRGARRRRAAPVHPRRRARGHHRRDLPRRRLRARARALVHTPVRRSHRDHRDRQLEPRTPRPSCRSGCRRGACRCRPTASPRRAARRMRRPSRSSARCPALRPHAKPAKARSRRAAEQEAARRMLDALEGQRQAGQRAAFS